MSADNHQIWGHQVPTFHLETIAEMRGNEWIKKIQDDDNFTFNSLIKDEKFLEAVRKGEIRHIRLSGHKLAPLGMDTGEFELGSGNGVSYGDLSMKDFIKNMLAMATYTYDKSSPLKKTPVFETKDGQKFVMAPVPIKILSDASTLDMVVMPVNHMIHQTDEGEIELTEEGLDLYINDIQEEYARIQKENDLETKDERTIEGFNTGEMRGLQLFNTGNLMNIREGNIKSTIRVQPPSLADVTIEGILEGNQKITLLSKAQSGKVRIAVGTTAVVELIKRDKAGGEYVAITNKGLSNVEDVDLARVIEDLGTMVYRTRPEARGKKEPLSFTYRKKKFWTFSWNLVNFVNGKQDFYILRYNTNIEGEAGIIDPTAEYNISERTVQELTELRDDAVEREEYELAQQLTNELDSRSEVSEFEIKEGEYLTQKEYEESSILIDKEKRKSLRDSYDSGTPIILSINTISKKAINSKMTKEEQLTVENAVIFNLKVKGNNIGVLAVDSRSNKIIDVEIIPEFRRLGLGVKLYKAAAKKLGGLISDNLIVSAKAQRVWESLVR